MLRRLRIENLVLIREAELELDPGLVALTGETGAGKTIVTQAIGLLLGAKGDTAAVGASASEAFVEAELDVPEGFFEEEGLETLRELRPEDEPRLVVARRVGSDGRARAYAWGRSVAREDLVAATERLLALSGQFAQRRLARPSHQLELLDAFVGPAQALRRAEAREAWRSLQGAMRRLAELEEGSGAERARLAELAALVDDTEGLVAGEEDALRQEAERGRHLTELAEGVSAALGAIDPEDGDGARSLAAAAERALAEAIAAARARGGRVVAVGTTTVRTLESWSAFGRTEGDTQIFITPGFRFQVVDRLITNFHLPKRTLLMLVSAFAGRDRVLAAYRHAVAAGYRFYSYGDAMLIA